MSGRTFFDTNVVVYTLNGEDPHKVRIAKTILRDAVKSHNAVVSYQVLQELFNVGFQKFKPAMTRDEARTYLDEVAPGFIVVPWSMKLIEHAIAIKHRYLFRWYDCLIVAAALEAKCDVLYSEDLHHEQRIEGLQVVNPFR